MNKPHLHVLLKILPGLFLFLSSTAYAGNVLVDYDASQDRIQVQASNASLTQVLAEIASKTNITIRIDPEVEKIISTNLPPQALQQALQKVVKGLSYVIEYNIDEKQQTVVSGLRLLPKGKQDSGQLVSVAVLNARAGDSVRDKDGGSQSKNPISEKYETRPLLSEEESALQGRTISSIRRKKPDKRRNTTNPITSKQDDNNDDEVTSDIYNPAKYLNH